MKFLLGIGFALLLIGIFATRFARSPPAANAGIYTAALGLSCCLIGFVVLVLS